MDKDIVAKRIQECCECGNMTTCLSEEKPHLRKKIDLMQMCQKYLIKPKKEIP